MAKIKIVEKFQGQALMRLNDEPWQKLIKLEEGTFVDSQTIITFKTTEGLSVTADKTSIYEEDDQKISYWGNMNELTKLMMIGIALMALLLSPKIVEKYKGSLTQ